MSLEIDVLKIINSSDTALSLNDILQNLQHLALQPRTLQRAIKKLIDVNRMTSLGAASNTSYWQKDVREAYAKDYRVLFVHKKDKIAGYFFYNQEVYVYTYTDQYLIDNEEPIVGLDFSIEPHITREIPIAFDENLPEGINREIFELSLQSANEFDMLERLSHNIGDVYFTQTGESLMPRAERYPSFLSHQEEILGKNIFPSILEGHTLDLSEEEIFPEGEDLSKYKEEETPGISGFQYKKLLNYDKERKLLYQDKEDSVRDYIFKPYSLIKSDPSSEYYLPHLAINEHLFMSFAKNELGFRVPETHLVKRDKDIEYHYIVKRFDRYKSYRYGKANFSTYLGLRAANKYQTTSEKMFRRMKKEILSKNERMQLLKYYFYSMLISHEDMHTKNLSLLINKGTVIMAPLYDVACTRIYTNMKGYDTYLTIDGQRTNITPRHFKKLVDILDVSNKEFMQEAEKIVKCYINIMPEYIARLKDLDPLEFYTMKQVSRVGRTPKWAKGEKKDFVQVLDLFVQKRIGELNKLGWVKNN